MKITTCILSIFIIGGQMLHAQSGKRQFIGVSAGISIPTGDFAQANIDDSTCGFARSGVNIQMTYGYRFTHNLGLQAQITYNSNAFDYIKYENGLMEQYPDYQVSVESRTNWSSGGILIGPYLRLPLTEQLSWDVRALFGLYGAYSPDIIIHTSKGALEKNDYYRNPGKGFSFGYSLGSGFKYQFSKYYLLLYADYVASPISIDNASGWDWNDQPYSTTFKQEINYISVSLGFAYLL